MKRQLKPLALGLGLLGFAALPVYAQDTNSQQLKALQKQVNALQKQVTDMKKSQPHHTKGSTTRPSTVTVPSPDTTKPDIGPENFPETAGQVIPVDFDTPGQSYVSTGPYLGVPFNYFGSNLVVNSPNINEDVALLRLRKNINDHLLKRGISRSQDHGHLILSGIVEGQAFYKQAGSGSNTSDIDVTSAELDAYILSPSDWVSGLLSFNYDNDRGTVAGSVNNNTRVSNSRVFINKAFVTIGDFSKTPLYGSIGQMYVPFGTYSTSMVASPLTKLLSRTKARAILLGYSPQVPNTFYTSAYVLRGDTDPGGAAKIDNGGINLGFKYSVGDFSGDIGAGVIGNIADSTGMQLTGNSPNFGGFGDAQTNCGPLGNLACGNENLVHRVPAYDVRGTLSVGKWDFIAEYITASTRFNPNDMMFNAHGASPQALNAEAAYSFTTFGNKPTSITFNYGMTKQALALGLPLNRYGVTLNTSWWKNTLQSLEFRRDKNYNGGSTASGSNISAAPGTGKANNVVTAQFDLYF